MGWDAYKITIYLSLDRHGGKEQEEADVLYEQLREEIRKIVEQAKYKPLSASL